MRMLVSLALLAVVALAAVSTAAVRVEERTLTGELIDVACNMKSIKSGGSGTSSANHADCTYLCARKGMPVGIKAADGVYWVVGSQTKADNKALLPFVNKQVRVTGPVASIDGRLTIDVRNIELVK